MQWLISMEYRAVQTQPSGVTAEQPTTDFVLIDQHPAVFIAEAKIKCATLRLYGYRSERGLERADDILRVYSVIEVPPGTLTDEQIDRLS